MHRWEPVDVQHGEWVILGRDTGSAGTLALYRCYCGKAEVRKLDGAWTLEQLQAKRAAR